MRTPILKNTVLLSLFAASLFVNLATAKDDIQSVTWSAHSAHLGCHMNMGPTGARVWMRGYQFQVMTIDAGSPAHNILERGDLITAADGTEFGEKADPRMTLGNAIGSAEASDGVLKLKILRDGKKKTVKITLPVTGPFSNTWPYDCKKTTRILYQACDYLRNAQMPDGEIITDGSAGLFPAGLLLLASGDIRYMDSARRAAYAAAGKDFEKIDYSHWAKGYGLVLMTEYYLATGDETVLPKIKEVADVVAKGQMRCGSWGHNIPGGGYGAMNQAGVICTIGMVLAQECGIEVDQVALGKALSFFGRYAELGAVPYGDHMPGTRAPDDNGKSASSAVLFTLLSDRQAEARAFSESIAMSAATRETGHTGGYFSMVWGPLGCAPTGHDSLHKFMDYQAWYYNLCRTWKGALVLLPYKEALTRFDDSSYNEAGGEFTTGGMGLAFALPMKQLRILGAPRSVFGAHIKGNLLKARDLYQARDWAAFDKVLNKLADSTSNAEEKRFAAQLSQAAEMVHATKARTIKEIKNNLAEGDAYRASEQYAALKRLLGEKDEDLVALAGKFEDGTTQWYMREGKQYYGGWREVRSSALKSWVPYYGDKAKLFFWEPREHAPQLWEDLAPIEDSVTNTWRVVRAESDSKLPRDWTEVKFDDDNWIECHGITGAPLDSEERLPSGRIIAARSKFEAGASKLRALRLKLRSARNAITDVYINGEQVAHVTRGQRGGHAKIELHDSALSLIRQGMNTLAITSTEPGNGANALDVGIQAVVAERPWEEPLMTGSLASGPQNGTMLEIPLPSLPEKERTSRSDQLIVENELRSYSANRDAEYDAMTVEALRAELDSPVAYRRYLAVSAITRRDNAVALTLAADALKHKSWRVRSSGCSIIDYLWPKHPDKSDAGSKAIKGQIPSLITLLGDEHFWVRVSAVNAIAAFGMDAETAKTALVKAASDPEEWVRTAALKALAKVTNDPAASLSAAAAAVKLGSSSFSLPGTAFAFVEKYAKEGEEGAPILIEMIDNPAEGMGAHVVAKALEQLVAVDQNKALPLLIKVALGGYEYDRLRGNPRGKAIELLGGLGAKAKPALPALKQILASDEDRNKKYHDAAAEAIQAIEGE